MKTKFQDEGSRVPAFQGEVDRNVCQRATADHITESHHMQGLSRGSAICLKAVALTVSREAHAL